MGKWATASFAIGAVIVASTLIVAAIHGWMTDLRIDDTPITLSVITVILICWSPFFPFSLGLAATDDPKGRSEGLERRQSVKRLGGG